MFSNNSCPKIKKIYYTDYRAKHRSKLFCLDKSGALFLRAKEMPMQT